MPGARGKPRDELRHTIIDSRMAKAAQSPIRSAAIPDGLLQTNAATLLALDRPNHMDRRPRAKASSAAAWWACLALAWLLD